MIYYKRENPRKKREVYITGADHGTFHQCSDRCMGSQLFISQLVVYRKQIQLSQAESLGDIAAF